MQCVYLEDAKYIKDYQVFLEFNDGARGIVDLRDIIHKYRQAEPLRTPQAFAQFYLDSWPTLAWECGFDVAPETLYEKCEQVDSADG